jgi:hypothetical protein
MKITLCENNHHFTLHIPLALLTASLWAKWVSREENDISGKTMQAIRKELRKDVKRFGHFTLVDIKSADGESVLIRL